MLLETKEEFQHSFLMNELSLKKNNYSLSIKVKIHLFISLEV